MDGCPRLRESGGFHSLLHGVRRALISVCAPVFCTPGLCPGPRPCAGSARGARPSGLPFPPAGAGALPRTPALRGQRQRGSPLWTPFPACGRRGSAPDPGPARAAPEGLAPLDSLSRLRAGRGFFLPFVPNGPARQNGGGLAGIHGSRRFLDRCGMAWVYCFDAWGPRVVRNIIIVLNF